MRTLSLFLTFLTLLCAAQRSRAEILVKSGETIAFLGDSITYQGGERIGGYIRLVASGLADQGVKVTTINAGWGGNTSAHMLGRLENHVLSKKPTWMTLSAGVNDVMHRAVELEDYKKNITSILDRAQQAGVKVVILTATQIGLPVSNTANVKLAGYNDFLRETAKARNLPLADVNAAMIVEQESLEKAGIKRALTTDGVHMNIYGNMVLAKGALAAFGLNGNQLAALQAKWDATPEFFETKPTVLPNLVDRTLELGGVIRVRGERAGNVQSGDKAFDNNTTTKWADLSKTSWIQYQFGGDIARVITGYVIASAEDSVGRDPKDWMLQGSNDGIEFATLDTQVNQSFSERRQSKSYQFTNSTAYKMYRLNITSNNGENMTQLSELRLLGP